MNQLVTSALILAGSGGALYYLRSIPQLIWAKLKKQFIYSVKVYQYDELFDVLEKYMCKHYTAQYRDVEACLIQGIEHNKLPPVAFSSGGSGIYTIPTVISQSVRYKQETNTFIIKYNGKRILITKSKERLDHVQNTKDLFFAKFHLSGFRAKEAIEDFISEAIKLSSVSPEENVVKVHSNNSWGDWEVGTSTKIKTMEKVVLSDKAKDLVISDMANFVSSEKWYEERGIPYKRGYCLYGPPGTGKTTLALAMAHKLQKAVRCLNMNSFDGDVRLINAFRNIPDNSILLIEDIDKIFSGRDNVRADSKVSFSSFLNCLDGAMHKHGLITIITTNHLDKLDEALLRTGRIDTKIEIPKPTDKEISKYLAIFYNNEVPIKGRFNLTMSDVQDICLRNKEDIYVAKNEIIKQLVKNDIRA